MLYDQKDTITIVGTKQTLKQLGQGAVKTVFVAKDADDRVTGQVLELAKAQNVNIEFVETMKELGKKCNIEVKTAVAAIIA
ncbi:MAG: 50S ribosomal protein L7ae-like protein [Cellulosilyticum sp.]|nr:50S ribosomal protein L7ae-like protein [Cellulosilyticum sp.]